MLQNDYIISSKPGVMVPLEYCVTTSCDEDSEDWFVDAKERLLDINNWNKYSHLAGIEFRLTDSKGRAVNRRAHKGDHIRIDAPGGFDWLAINALVYDDYPDISMETFTMRLHPATNPLNVLLPKYSDNSASATMAIERIGKKLFATYHNGEKSHNEQQGAGKAAEEMILAVLYPAPCQSLLKGFIGDV